MAQIDISVLLQGLTLAVLLWFGRGFLILRDEVLKLRILLTGEDGKNGVRGDVKALREKADNFGMRLHDVEHEVESMRGAT